MVDWWSLLVDCPLAATVWVFGCRGVNGSLLLVVSTGCVICVVVLEAVDVKRKEKMKESLTTTRKQRRLRV
jgi:hypothetical protein